MNFGAQKDAQARCRTDSLPSGHIRMHRVRGERYRKWFYLRTVIVVPSFPAQGFGSALAPF